MLLVLLGLSLGPAVPGAHAGLIVANVGGARCLTLANLATEFGRVRFPSGDSVEFTIDTYIIDPWDETLTLSGPVTDTTIPGVVGVMVVGNYDTGDVTLTFFCSDGGITSAAGAGEVNLQ
jgi:hypothetical protein